MAYSLVMDDKVLVINDKLSIPLVELDFRFTTSGGPGGQHANRAATRATVRFDIAGSPSLPDDIRARLLSKLGAGLTQTGVLQMSADSERSQYRNRALVLARLKITLANALLVPKKRRPTRPSQAARVRRHEEKKRRSRRKEERRRRWEE